jgi:DNA-binding response OmpR family regulator
MLPKLDGLSFIQRIRSRKMRVPVIILSAKASVMTASAACKRAGMII